MFEVMFTQEGWLFSIPALVGTAVFLMKLAIMAVGAGHGDVDGAIDAAGDVTADAHGSTHDFSVLSLQSIAALLMGFGWGGLTARFALEWDIATSVVIGLGVGALMVWLLGLMMKAMYDLQASGNISLHDAVGLHGTVYATVPQPSDGRGQVKLVVRGRSRIFNAVSEQDAIPTNASVRVIRANNDNTLTVGRVG